MYPQPQNHTGRNGGLGQTFDGPAPRLSRNVPDYVGPGNIFTVVVPSQDVETLHEVQVVLGDLFQFALDQDDFASAVNQATGETLVSLQTHKAAGFVAINTGLRALADRHQFSLAYTYGPVGIVSPSVGVHDLQGA
jgi:hypothetical protein